MALREGVRSCAFSTPKTEQTVSRMDSGVTSRRSMETVPPTMRRVASRSTAPWSENCECVMIVRIAPSS